MWQPEVPFHEHEHINHRWLSNFGLGSLARIATLDGDSSIRRVLDEFLLHVVAVKRNTFALDKLMNTPSSEGGFKRCHCGGGDGRSSRFLRRASKHRATTGASKRRRGCGGGRSSLFLLADGDFVFKHDGFRMGGSELLPVSRQAALVSVSPVSSN